MGSERERGMASEQVLGAGESQAVSEPSSSCEALLASSVTPRKGKLYVPPLAACGVSNTFSGTEEVLTAVDGPASPSRIRRWAIMERTGNGETLLRLDSSDYVTVRHGTG